MIAESTAAIKVAVQWLATPFRFAAGCHRILQGPEVGRVDLCAVSLWLSGRMGFDILMPLSGIDALLGL